MKKILFIIIIFGILTTEVALAADAATNDNGTFIIPNPLKAESIEALIKAISGLLVVIAIPIAAIMIIWGGIQYLTSAGKEEQTKKARDIIKWAIIGLAIILATDFIIGFLQEVLGRVNN